MRVPTPTRWTLLNLLIVCGLAGCATGRSADPATRPPAGRSNETKVAEANSYVLLRPTASGPQIELPPDLMAQHAGSLVEPIYELCLDFPNLSGSSERPTRSSAPAALTKVRPAPGLPGADAAIESGLRALKWSVVSSRPPDQLKAGPFCWLQHLRFAIPAPSEIVPGAAFSHRTLKGAEPHLPASVRLAHSGETLDASYHVCLDRESGRVKDIKTLIGIPGADADLMDLLRTWTWHVELPPEFKRPLCFTQDFQFVIPGEPDNESIWLAGTADAPPYKLAILPAIISVVSKEPAAPPASSAPAVTVKKQLLYNPLPHLPDSLKAQYVDDLVLGTYKICIGLDGSVSSVDHILPIFGATQSIHKTLSSWRFAPVPIPLCYIQILEFQVGRTR